MDLDQEFSELYEGWKKGKYKITDDKGNIIGTYNSGSKAQKVVDDLMQQGKYDKLTVEIIEDLEKEADTYRKKKYAKKSDKQFGISRKKSNVRHGGTGYGEDVEEDYDKNQLLRVQHDERLIAEAGDICSLDRSDLRSKSMQKVYDKKCSPEMIKKKKSIFGKIAKGLDLYNQNSIGEEKMDLIETSRNILIGEKKGDKEAYQKFFNKALAKFGVDSPAELKDDEKKKFYDYVDKNWKGDHEEEVEVKKKVTKEETVEEKVNLKKLKKEYEENEDKNYHRENYLLLAKAFGTKAEIKKVEEIIARSEKQGHTSKKDNDWMYKHINPYYDNIRNEEVGKPISKLFAHVKNLMKK